MPTLRYPICRGLLLAGFSVLAQAAGTNVQVSATVHAVNCTPEQRAMSRACAPADQRLTVEPVRTAKSVAPKPGEQQLPGPQFEVEIDHDRGMIVRTFRF